MERENKKIILRYEDENPKFGFVYYTDTSTIGLPRIGDLININKTNYEIEKIITNINKSSSSNVIVTPIDNISYYVKLIKKKDKVEEKKESKAIDVKENTEDIVGSLSNLIRNCNSDVAGSIRGCTDILENIKQDIQCIPRLEKIEELKDFISNIEFKMVSEEYEDGTPVDDNILEELKNITEKLDTIAKPKVKTPVLNFTREFLLRVKSKNGRGYTQKPLKVFKTKGIKIKAPDNIKLKSAHSNSNGETNYICEYSYNEDTKTYEAIETNFILVDDITFRKKVLESKEYYRIIYYEDITKYTLSDWFRFSILWPDVVIIENDLDKDSDYLVSNELINYHIRNK